MAGQIALTPADHARVAEFVQGSAGIQLPAHKRSLVESRLRRRVVAGGYRSITDYLDAVLTTRGSMSERALLIDALTTNKTEFFRERSHFEFLDTYLRSRLSASDGRVVDFRVWSAACSTGEEAYSLAMVLQEMRVQYPAFSSSVVASDIAPSVLERARRGIYPASRVEPIPMELRRRYLLRSRDHSRELVRVAPLLRHEVEFFPFNLLSDDYPEDESLDAVFCRNVMIYFSDRDRARVVERMRHCLRPGGLLFVGHSESIGRRAEFETVRPAVFRRRESAR